MKHFSLAVRKKLIAQEKFNVKKDLKIFMGNKNKTSSSFLFIFLTLETWFYIFYNKLYIFSQKTPGFQSRGWMAPETKPAIAGEVEENPA